MAAKSGPSVFALGNLSKCLSNPPSPVVYIGISRPVAQPIYSISKGTFDGPTQSGASHDSSPKSAYTSSSATTPRPGSHDNYLASLNSAALAAGLKDHRHGFESDSM